MSLGIYPVFNPKVPELVFDGGEALAAEFPALDELADRYNLARLTSFADTRVVPEGFDGPPEELEKVIGPWADWFPCGDGRVAFERLATLITDTPAAAQALQAPDAVAADLRALMQALAVGEAQGAQFRLEMS